MAETVRLFEVGPRDGLQNEKLFIPTQDKVRLIDCLSMVGFQNIEVASFVSPKWVPQMADGEEVMAAISRNPDVSYAALTPNMKGYQRARMARADELAIFASASETFSEKNINCSIADSLERFKPVVKAAEEDDIPVRGYVSCVVRCPYDGDVIPANVARVGKALIDMGCYEVSLGDTIGAGTPDTIDAMLDAVLSEIEASRLAGHYHDTGEKALANIEVSLEKGLRVFDSAIGGLGGCPYAPGAKGNVETLAVFEHLSALGYEAGLDGERLRAAGRLLNEIRAGL